MGEGALVGQCGGGWAMELAVLRRGAGAHVVAGVQSRPCRVWDIPVAEMVFVLRVACCARRQFHRARRHPHLIACTRAHLVSDIPVAGSCVDPCCCCAMTAL